MFDDDKGSDGWMDGSTTIGMDRSGADRDGLISIKRRRMDGRKGWMMLKAVIEETLDNGLNGQANQDEWIGTRRRRRQTIRMDGWIGTIESDLGQNDDDKGWMNSGRIGMDVK
eukprot:NP_508717.1 Uncharacterized protein CELE_F20B6.7 [Caenorhabditis elegans]